MVYSGGKTCQKTKIGTGSTSTGTAILVSENHTGDVHISADSRGSPLVKSNADKGEHNSHGSIEIISEELTSKDLKDFLRLGKNAYLHLDGTTTKESISVRIDLKSVSPIVIEGEACQTTDESSLGAKSNTHQDDGSIGSSQEGQGVSSQKLKIGIAGPESNTHLDDGSTLTDKGFMVSENNTCHVGLLSTTADGMLMGIDSCSSPAVKSNAGKGEACQTTDEFSLDSESNTHQDDGSTGRYRKGKGEIYQITYVDDGSTASPVFLGGFQDGKAFLRKFDDFQEVTTSEVVKGFSSQKLKIGNADSENNTHLDDGSTSTDKGLLVSENNTCHVDVSTTTDGIVNEAISKDLEDGPYPATVIQQLQFRRSNYLHQFQMDLSERDTDRYDGLTIKESISPCNDPSVPPTVKPMSGKGKTPQITDVPCLDSESNTPQEDADSQEDVSSSKTKLGIAGPENNTHLDDGSTLTDKGFLVSENNTCHVDLSTTAEGIVNEAISKDWEDETPQITDVPCLDSESNTPQEDADSQEVQGASMESLPSDIIQEILSRVPAESVLGCKLVCKKWITLIRGSNFANMHLNHQLASTVEPCLFFACTIEGVPAYRTLLYHGGQVSDRISLDEKYTFKQNLKRIYHPLMHDVALTDHLVGSCNGLVCAFQVHHTVTDPIYICNPHTREYVYLPQLIVNREDVHPDLLAEGEVDMYNYTACGFGYVRSTSEYKVVRIHYIEEKVANVEVYTLGSGCGWRSIGTITYELNTTRGGRGIYVNDAIYWTSGNKVVAFHLADEEFRFLSVPRMGNRTIKDICGLVALGRHLCLYIDDQIHVEIWSLTESSDSKEIGSMKFDINYQALPDTRRRWIQPILLTKNGEIIFLYAESVLYCYDPKTKVLKMISDEASTDYFDAVDAIAHMSSFTSLKAMGENSKRYTFRPQRCRTPWDHVIDELDRGVLGEEIDATRFKLR